MTEWQSGRVAEWQSGRVAEWQSGRVAEWHYKRWCSARHNGNKRSWSTEFRAKKNPHLSGDFLCN